AVPGRHHGIARFEWIDEEVALRHVGDELAAQGRVEQDLDKGTLVLDRLDAGVDRVPPGFDRAGAGPAQMHLVAPNREVDLFSVPDGATPSQRNLDERSVARIHQHALAVDPL